MDHEGVGVCAGETEVSQGDGTVIDLHVMAPADAAGAESGAAGADGAAVLARAGAVAGQPFLLGTDGSYDVQLNLCVPITSSTSCHQAIFVDQATDLSLSADAVLVEIDRLG